jgi:DNA processing protein
MPLSDLHYWVAFNRIRQIGPVRFSLLLRGFRTLEEAWAAPAARLRETGLDETGVRAILASRPDIHPEEELAALEKHGIRAVTWNDPDYPERLREAGDSPPVLFVKGVDPPGPELAVAIVGTRKMTPYGRQVTDRLTRGLAESGVTIVSGLARGIDGIAHRAALEAGGRTAAVLANGLDSVYPAEHTQLARQIAEAGCLLSEYPPGVRTGRDFFPRRNRIISGLCLGVLVVEGAHDSGALITARHALDQGREVFAVPGSVFSSVSQGPNLLIQRGEAKLVTQVSDILEELNLSVVQSQPSLPIIGKEIPAGASESEATLLKHLTDQPIHIDDVRRASGLPVSTVSSLLQILELKGFVRQVGGMNYVRT